MQHQAGHDQLPLVIPMLFYHGYTTHEQLVSLIHDMLQWGDTTDPERLMRELALRSAFADHVDELERASAHWPRHTTGCTKPTAASISVEKPFQRAADRSGAVPKDYSTQFRFGALLAPCIKLPF